MEETPEYIRNMSQNFAQGILQVIKEENISKSVVFTTFVNLIPHLYSKESDDDFEQFIDGLREARDTIMTELNLYGKQGE